MGHSKPDHWYEQSGVVPYREMGGEVEVLLITSLRKSNWIVPKGIVEDNLSAEDSAMKEAFEEAGVEGQIVGNELGRYEVAKWGGICRVCIFAMCVTRQFDDWAEANVRQRQWMPVDEAVAAVKSRDLAEIIAALGNRLASS